MLCVWLEVFSKLVASSPSRSTPEKPKGIPYREEGGKALLTTGHAGCSSSPSIYIIPSLLLSPYCSPNTCLDLVSFAASRDSRRDT